MEAAPRTPWLQGSQSEKHSSGPPPTAVGGPRLRERRAPSGLLQRPPPAHHLCPDPECTTVLGCLGMGAGEPDAAAGAPKPRVRAQVPAGRPRGRSGPLSSFRRRQKSSGFLSWRRVPPVTAAACPRALITTPSSLCVSVSLLCLEDTGPKPGTEGVQPTSWVMMFAKT